MRLKRSLWRLLLDRTFLSFFLYCYGCTHPFSFFSRHDFAFSSLVMHPDLQSAPIESGERQLIAESFQRDWTRAQMDIIVLLFFQGFLLSRRNIHRDATVGPFCSFLSWPSDLMHLRAIATSPRRLPDPWGLLDPRLGNADRETNVYNHPKTGAMLDDANIDQGKNGKLWVVPLHKKEQ